MKRALILLCLLTGCADPLAELRTTEEEIAQYKLKLSEADTAANAIRRTKIKRATLQREVRELEEEVHALRLEARSGPGRRKPGR